VVFLLQCFRVLETRRTDVNAKHTSPRMAERKFSSLPGSTSGYQQIEVGPILLVRPVEMVFRTMYIFVLPHLTRPIEIFDRRWIWVIGVEVTNWIGAHSAAKYIFSHKKAQKLTLLPAHFD